MTTLSDFADQLAHQPEAARRLINAHQADGDGKCKVCSAGAQTGRSAWPCTLYVAAKRAMEIYMQD